GVFGSEDAKKTEFGYIWKISRFQFVDPADAAEAKYQIDGQGRELTVVFAEENRKKPTNMRLKERGYTDRRPSPPRRYSRSPTPRHGKSRAHGPAAMSTRLLPRESIIRVREGSPPCNGGSRSRSQSPVRYSSPPPYNDSSSPSPVRERAKLPLPSRIPDPRDYSRGKPDRDASLAPDSVPDTRLVATPALLLLTIADHGPTAVSTHLCQEKASLKDNLFILISRREMHNNLFIFFCMDNMWRNQRRGGGMGSRGRKGRAMNQVQGNQGRGRKHRGMGSMTQVQCSIRVSHGRGRDSSVRKNRGMGSMTHVQCSIRVSHGRGRDSSVRKNRGMGNMTHVQCSSIRVSHSRGRGRNHRGFMGNIIRVRKRNHLGRGMGSSRGRNQVKGRGSSRVSSSRSSRGIGNQDCMRVGECILDLLLIGRCPVILQAFDVVAQLMSKLNDIVQQTETECSTITILQLLTMDKIVKQLHQIVKLQGKQENLVHLSAVEEVKPLNGRLKVFFLLWKIK
ncbi:LOW QUALITY PROTEIN: hypothetical protein M8C21_025869, partial [Ambrosia artemisiifolia]